MEPDRRAAERAFAAGRYLDFLRAVGSDKGDFDQTVIRGLIPSVDLEEVDFSAGTTPNTLFELAAAVWDVDELLAISMFREAASGGSSAALAALGEGLNWIGDHEEATLWLRKAISANAGDAARLAGLLGESLFSAGDSVRFSEAEHLLKRGLAESEEFGVPLAKLLLAQQKVAEARELLERLVGADVYGAALLLGNLLAEEPGNLEAAEAAYRAGIASGDGHSAHNLAVMMLENGEPARARELHELAKLMGDSSPPGDRTRLDATQPASGASASNRRVMHHAWRDGPSASCRCGLVWGRARSSRFHLTLIGMRRAALPTGPLKVATDKQWVKLEKVAGSAAGARVGSLLWGTAASVLTVAVSWGTSSWWIGASVCFFAAAAFVRSLFLGVWVEPGAVVVCTWFRRRHFRSGEIVAVDKQLYYGGGGAGVGWLPFVGSVRMIELERVDGKRVPLPSTIGRRNHVLRLARRMREALDLPLR